MHGMEIRDRVPMLLRSQGTKGVYPGFWHQNVSVTALIERYPGSQKKTILTTLKGKVSQQKKCYSSFLGGEGMIFLPKCYSLTPEK